MMRRPESLVEVAERRATRPGEPLWKPLGEFLDTFYEMPQGRTARLADEPVAPIAREEAAYLAAVADHLSLTYRLPHPLWTEKPQHFLDTAWWPENRGRAFEAICLAESPTAFRRRFIFTEAQPLRRKGGPVLR